MSGSEPFGKPVNMLDKKVKNKEELELALKVKELDQRNLIKKNADYYNNDLNMWNNSYRLNKKFYSQYHEKKDYDEKILTFKQDKIRMKDKERQFRSTLNFRRNHRNALNKQKENIKLNRLLVQKDASQKIVEDALDNKFLDGMNNIDKHDERKRIQNRTNVINKISSINLWENNEALDQKHQNNFLTEAVLKKEKEGIEMIVDKIKKECVEDGYQKKLEEANTNSIRKLFLKQRLENSKKLLHVNLPETSCYYEQSKNDFGKKIKELEKTEKDTFFNTLSKQNMVKDDEAGKSINQNTFEGSYRRSSQNRLISAKVPNPIQLDKESIHERTFQKTNKEVHLVQNSNGRDVILKPAMYTKDDQKKVNNGAVFVTDNFIDKNLISLKKYENYDSHEFEKQVSKEQPNQKREEASDMKTKSYSVKSLSKDIFKKSNKVESSYYYIKAPFPLEEDEEPTYPLPKNDEFNKKGYVRNVHSEYGAKNTNKSEEKIKMRPNTVNTTMKMNEKVTRTESATNLRYLNKKDAFLSSKNFIEFQNRHPKEIQKQKLNLSASKEDQAMFTNKLSEAQKNKTTESFAKSVKLCENSDFLNMMSKDITQIKIEQENPYIIALKNNIDPEHFLPYKHTATNQTLRSLTANSYNNTRITTAKSFVKKNKIPKYKLIDNFDTISKNDQKNRSIDFQETNAQELNDIRTTCMEIDDFNKTHKTKSEKDQRFMKGFPSVRFDKFMGSFQNAYDPMLNEQRAEKENVVNIQKKLFEFNDRILF